MRKKKPKTKSTKKVVKAAPTSTVAANKKLLRPNSIERVALASMDLRFAINKFAQDVFDKALSSAIVQLQHQRRKKIA